MNSRPAQSVTPLVGVALAILGLSLLSRAGHLAVLAGHLRSDLLGPVLIAALAVGLSVLMLSSARVVLTRRLLASRTRLVLLAPDSFDPGLDAVLRCAAQLSRVRRLGGWFDSRASAVRVLLDRSPDGRVRYSLVVPGHSLPALRAALSVYDHVQIRLGDPNAEPPGSDRSPEGRRDERECHVVRSELRLARPSHEPLAQLALDPDPLQSFVRVIEELHDDEQVKVALDLLPCAAGGARRLRRRLLKDARKAGGYTSAGNGLLELLRGAPRQGRQGSSELIDQRFEREQLAAKLLHAEPLFAMQILLRCRSPIRGRALGQMQALQSCFDAFSASNSLRAVGVHLLGHSFLGSDLPGRRAWFDRRMDTGLFAPARRGYVGAREIAGWLKPPTVHCGAPGVLRLGPAVHPVPRSLPTFPGRRPPELVPLGQTDGPDGQRMVGLRLADTFFSYTAGRSRWGKSEMAIGQFVHLVSSGHGGMFIDPHQDAIARIKSFLTEPEIAARVIELDLVGSRSHHGQPAWNLLATRGLSDEARELRVEAIVDAFASALGWTERNNRALTLTTQAVAALAELSAQLPEDLAPTLFQIPTLLGDSEWREAVLPLLSPYRRQFFTERFARMGEEAITPVTNLIDRLRSSTPLAALLGAQAAGYDIARAMDEKRIVLACPGAGGARDRLLANLLVFDLLHGAKSRAHLPPQQRRPFYVFLDEVQTYDGASSGNLAALLEQTAKYGIRAFLLNQNPERLTAATRNALVTNRSHLIATALDSHAAALIAREWAGQPDAAAIAALPRFHFLAQVTDHAALTRPFLVQGVPAEQLAPEQHHPELVARVQPLIDQASGRLDSGTTIAALDTLDERIKDHLAPAKQNDQQAPGDDDAPVASAPVILAGEEQR